MTTKPKRIKWTIPVTGASWSDILNVATEAIVRGDDCLILELNVGSKFRRGFPKGIISKGSKINTNYHKISAKKLLDFVFMQGKSSYNTKMLQGDVNKMDKLLEKFDEEQYT